MLSVGFVVLLAGYSAVYVGVTRLRGDKRGVIDIWKGVGALNSNQGSSSSGSALGNPKALGPLKEVMPGTPGSGGSATSTGPGVPL